MADDWLGISSSEYDSHCGDSNNHNLTEALDAQDYWEHLAVHALPHWFIIDLGQTYTIKQLRGRSNTDADPIDIDVYVSDSKTNWGTAVSTGINTWQDTENWVTIDSTDKNGRYIKVEIYDTENILDKIDWGKTAEPHMTIFDAYGEIYALPFKPRPTAAIGLSHII